MTPFVLYQTLHVARGRVRNLAAHAALLDAAAREVFGLRYTPDLPRLAGRVEALTVAEHYPRTVSGFVRLELTPDGQDRLLPAGVSLYDGYALRTLTPDAVLVDCEVPVSQAPTTAREAASQLADCMARRTGAAVAVCCDRDGILRMADDAPLFGVRGKALIPGADFPSVERDLVLRTAHDTGLRLSPERLSRELLPRLDELFYADHRGITALAHCDGWPLMALSAERIAAAMEARFPKT